MRCLHVISDAFPSGTHLKEAGLTAGLVPHVLLERRKISIPYLKNVLCGWHRLHPRDHWSGFILWIFCTDRCVPLSCLAQISIFSLHHTLNSQRFASEQMGGNTAESNADCLIVGCPCTREVTVHYSACLRSPISTGLNRLCKLKCPFSPT
jgi:hypothetical protein